MFGASLEIQLTPQRVSLRKKHGYFGTRLGEAWEIMVEPAGENQPSWHPAVAACAELHAKQRPKDLHFVFSDLWVRYDLIQLGPNELSDAEAISLAQAHFIHLYPDLASWPLRLALQGKQLLVAAMDPAFLAALRESAATMCKRVSGAEPLFSRVFDLHARELSNFDGWMLLDEPGILIAAYIDKGLLLSFRSQFCEDRRAEAADLLLKRQEALLGKPATRDVRIYSCMDHPVSLGEPWHCKQIATLRASPA